MDAEFWHERWRDGRLAFHQTSANDRLVRYWSDLAVPEGIPVFVPLCGKTLDMTWLAEAGHPVIGAELSEIAVRDYFAEAGLEPELGERGAFRVAEAGRVRLLCGDVFDLEPEHLAGVGAFYDRAALVALPRPLRQRYAETLAATLPRSVSGLLLSFEYDQTAMDGPPFSVEEDEVRSLFEPHFEVRRLARNGPAAAPPRFRERGLELLGDVVYALRRGAATA